MIFINNLIVTSMVRVRHRFVYKFSGASPRLGAFTNAQSHTHTSSSSSMYTASFNPEDYCSIVLTGTGRCNTPGEHPSLLRLVYCFFNVHRV